MSEFKVFEGVNLTGTMNTEDDVIKENVAYAIRQQHPQIWPQPPQMDRICLVGGGPSLEDTKDELIQLMYEGAKIVTVNGAYQWCLKNNIRPSCQIVVDARQSNARFLNPEIPNCRYFIASQCHKDTWDALKNRPHVAIFHSAAQDNAVLKTILDEYYQNMWIGVSGGSTVILRAIGLLRVLGYLRFDLFGVDSCFLNGTHHAYKQPENDQDKIVFVKASPSGRPDLMRKFVVTPWHLAQAEDFIQFVRYEGNHFLLNVHGNGLLAFLLQTSCEIVYTDVV